jgi:hypothetical protein
MSKQKYTKDELDKMMPVFHLKPASSTRSKCILTLYIDKAEHLNDDQLEVETTNEIKEKIGDNTLLIGVVNNYVIIGKYCACNISGSFLVENTKIPIYYLSIIYNKQFVTGCLFNIFLYFTIYEDVKKKLDDSKKYYKAVMNGKFTVQCVPTDDDFLDKVKSCIERDVMIKYNDVYCNYDDNVEKQDLLMEKMLGEINGQMAEFEQFFASRPFDKDDNRIPSQKATFKTLNEMCDNPVLKKLIAYGLDMREKERIEQKCPDASYEAPKNIINLREIKENPAKLDAIMAQRKAQGIE